MKITYSDYFALNDSRLEVLCNFEDDPAVANYALSLGFAAGAMFLHCKAGMQMVVSKEGYGEDRRCIAYVNTVEGKVTNVKFRAIDVKGFTQWRLPDKELPIPPYNIDCIWPENLDGKSGLTLIVTEGEKDVCSLVTVGYRYVISVPNGAQAKPEEFLDPFREWMQAVSRVIICHDEDEAGYKMCHAMREYMRDSLGKAVGVTHLPSGFKDISDVLHARGEAAVKEVIDAVKFPDSRHLVFVKAITTAVLDVLHGLIDPGYGTGFGELTDRHLWLSNEGGLIVVTGKPNSGKTDWCRCLMTHLAFQRYKGVCFCSFEEPNKAKHLASLVRIALGTNNFDGFTPNQIVYLTEFMDRHIVNISLDGMAPTPYTIIRLCEEAMRRQPIHFLYIDPYLFIEPDHKIESETQQIKKVLTVLQTWGRQRHVWVVIVAHPRKLVKDGTGKFEEIDEYTISGSAHWANLADYLLSVKRVFLVPSKAKEADGSANPSFTEVNVMKVRDQSLCHTGRMYFVRQSCGRYDERPSEDSCKRELSKAMPMPGDVRTVDDSMWIELPF